jgi:predicted dinucleotide-binding enzyme
MRVVLIGKGTIGSAISKVLEENGHEVVPVSRNSGKFRADISDSESLKALFSSIGPFNVASSRGAEAALRRRSSALGISRSWSQRTERIDA